MKSETTFVNESLKLIKLLKIRIKFKNLAIPKFLYIIYSKLCKLKNIHFKSKFIFVYSYDQLAKVSYFFLNY